MVNVKCATETCERQVSTICWECHQRLEEDAIEAFLHGNSTRGEHRLPGHGLELWEVKDAAHRVGLAFKTHLPEAIVLYKGGEERIYKVKDLDWLRRAPEVTVLVKEGETS